MFSEIHVSIQYATEGFVDIYTDILRQVKERESITIVFKERLLLSFHFPSTQKISNKDFLKMDKESGLHCAFENVEKLQSHRNNKRL